MRLKLAVGVVITLALTVLVRTELVDTASVSSDSMAPTVCTGDTVLLARVHDTSSVGVGDIVTFASPEDGASTIKRIVAVAGQRVAIEDALLVVDGQVVDEPYVDHASIDGVYFGPVTVPLGEVFVMGDRREISIDSRAYGAIPRSRIDGRLLRDLHSRCEHPSR